MRLKEALTTAVLVGVGVFGVGIVLRRLKRKRRKGKKKKQSLKKGCGKSSLPNLVSSVGGSSKHEIRFEDLVKLATCENPQLRKYALELCVFKVTQPSSSSSSPRPLSTVFKFCRRLVTDVEDENGIKALAVLACLTMHGVSSASVRSSSAWFHSHPQSGDLIHLLASVVEALSRSFIEAEADDSSSPSTPPHHLHLPLTSSPNDRFSGARFDPRILHPFSPPSLQPSSSHSSTRSHLPTPTNLYLLKMSLGSLFRVTVDAAPAKTFLLERHPHFLTTVLTLVEMAPSKDVVRFGFFLLHQLALLVPPNQFHVEDAAAIIATALRKYQGEPVLEKLGLQILVILFKTASETDGLLLGKSEGIRSLLTRLIRRESLLLPLVSCFRHASTDVDSDIIYWSCVIIHEFTANDVEVKTIAQTPGIFVSLTRALMVAEATPRPLIVKIIYQLSAGSELFRLQVLYNRDLLQRIAVVCYVNEPTHTDRELTYWCLLLVHDLAMLGPPMTSDLLSVCRPAKKKSSDGKDLLESLISIRRLHDPFLSRLLAETLGFFCSDERIHGRLLKAGIVDAVLSYMDTTSSSPVDPDLLLWAVASLLNLAMTSKAAQKAILHHGGVSVLLHLVDKGCPPSSPSRGQIAVMAAKTLTMLSHTDEHLLVEVEVDESVCVIRVGGRQMNNTFVSKKQPQLTIPRSSSAVIVILDLVASTGVISDMSAFFTAETGATVDALARTEDVEDGKTTSKPLVDAAMSPEEPLISHPRSKGVFQHPPQLPPASSEPNLDSLVFHCVSPSRLVLVWWPRRDSAPSPLLNQIIAEANVNEGVLMRLPAKDQFCVVIGKVEDSSRFHVTSFHVGGVESRHVTTFPFAEVCASAVARGVLVPLIDTIEKRLKEKASLNEELEYIEILSRQPKCQRVLMSDRVLHLFFEMIGLVDEQLERIVATRDAFDKSGGAVVTHAVGCLRILSVMAMNRLWAETFLEGGLLGLICGLLRRLLRIWIEMMAASCAMGEEVSLRTLQKCFSEESGARSRDPHHGSSNGHSLPDPSMPEFVSDSPSCSPPWYATPDTSTPGEKYFTPSIDDDKETIKYFGRHEMDAAPSNNEGKSSAVSSAIEGLTFLGPSLYLDDEEVEFKDASTPDSFDDLEPGRTHQRPISIGQDDEFILLPAFNPDFDEIFTSLTKSTLVLITNLVNVYTSSTRDPAKYFPNERINATFSVWSILTSSNAILKQWIGIPASATLSSLADVSDEKNEPSIRVNGDDAYGGCESELVTLSAEDKTLGLLLNAPRLQATNFNWTFESVRATHGVGGLACFHSTDLPPHGWYFEVTLQSSGIIQLGWAAKSSGFQPVEGMGVGDTKWSFAFDGSRCKTWNGPVTSERDNNYGKEWSEGDIVSCLMRNKDGVGEIEYWLRGESLGIAFSRIDLRKYVWYPAASFATDQMCAFNFGAFPFQYRLPNNFTSVQCSIADRNILKETREEMIDKMEPTETSIPTSNYLLPESAAKNEKNRSHSCSTSPRLRTNDSEESEGIQWSSNAELRSDGDHSTEDKLNPVGLVKPTTLDLKHKFSSYCRPKQDLSSTGGKLPLSQISPNEVRINLSFASVENACDDDDDDADVDNRVKAENSERRPEDPFHVSEPTPSMNLSIPSMYFECSLHKYSTHFSIGFRSLSSSRDGPFQDVVISFDADRKSLNLPDDSSVALAPAETEATLGVGLWLFPDSPPKVAFVKNGIVSSHTFTFTNSSHGSNHDDFFVPILSRRDLNVNWGQSNFQFGYANAKECKILASSYFYKKMIALS